jgi:hypothetical protein
MKVLNLSSSSHYPMTVPLNCVRGLSTKTYLKFIDVTGSNALSTSICGCAGTFFNADVQEVCLSSLQHNRDRTPPSLENGIWIGDVSLVPPRVLTLPESILHVRCFPSAYIVELHSGNKEGASRCSWSQSTRKCFHIPAPHKTCFYCPKNPFKGRSHP